MADTPPVGSNEWWRTIAGEYGENTGPTEGSPGFGRWLQGVQQRHGWRLGSNGQAVGNGPQNQWQPPNPSPTTTGQYEENLLANPGFGQRAQQNPLGLDAALLYSILGSREANAATEKDYKETQGILYRNRDNSRQLLEGAGRTALQDEQRGAARQQALTGSSLMDRGLYNTTVYDALSNRNREQSSRRTEEINRNTAGQRNQSDTMYAQLLAQNSASRQRNFQGGSIYNNLAQMANQPRGQSNSSSLFAGIGSLAGGLLPFLAA